MEFRRKNIRLPRPCYLGQQWCFLTACTEGRAPWLKVPSLVDRHLALLSEEAKEKSFLIQAYCFMPDHLYLLVSGQRPRSDCLAFINTFKQRSAFAFKQATGQRLWQHKPYDHILRPDHRWESVGYYIWMNPVRKGLCARPEDWSHSGSQTVDWRRLLSPPKILWVPPWKSSAGL